MTDQMVPCPGGTLYQIRPGDSYYSLAARFNTTIDALIAANPGVEPTNLQIGMTICIPVAPPPGPCPGGFAYRIQAGDTFYSIARRYGIAVQALIAANPNVDPNNLQIGQLICVPAPSPIPPCPGFLYTIRAGDTLYSLARRYNTSVEAIMSANPGIDPNSLRVGQIICIPGGGICPQGTSPYTIKAGDTLFALARQFNTTVEAILNANPGINPNNLQIGQQICIPS